MHGPALKRRSARASGGGCSRDVSASGGGTLRGGPATAIRWIAALATTGTVAARPQGRARRSKLDPHEMFLRNLIDGEDDITAEEMRIRLRDEHGLAVGLGTLWSFLDARDLTYKKRRPTPPSRSIREASMKALLLNTLLGLGLGRFSTIWMAAVFGPIVAAEVAYGIYAFHLSTGACVRRTATLFTCAQLAFVLGALMRPMRGET